MYNLNGFWCKVAYYTIAYIKHSITCIHLIFAVNQFQINEICSIKFLVSKTIFNRWHVCIYILLSLIYVSTHIPYICIDVSMMTSSNGIFSVLLALCEGNSPVTGEFPSQRPVTRSFDVFFDLRLNKSRVNNREAGDLRCPRFHYDVIVMSLYIYVEFTCNRFSLLTNNNINLVEPRAFEHLTALKMM